MYFSKQRLSRAKNLREKVKALRNPSLYMVLENDGCHDNSFFFNKNVCFTASKITSFFNPRFVVETCVVIFV